MHVYGQAPADGSVHAVARLLKAGRTVVVCGVDVTDGDGEPVAIGTAPFMVAPDPRAELPTARSTARPTPTSDCGSRSPSAPGAGGASRVSPSCPVPTTG